MSGILLVEGAVLPKEERYPWVSSHVEVHGAATAALWAAVEAAQMMGVVIRPQRIDFDLVGRTHHREKDVTIIFGETGKMVDVLVIRQGSGGDLWRPALVVFRGETLPRYFVWLRNHYKEGRLIEATELLSWVGAINRVLAQTHPGWVVSRSKEECELFPSTHSSSLWWDSPLIVRLPVLSDDGGVGYVSIRFRDPVSEHLEEARPDTAFLVFRDRQEDLSEGLNKT